MTIVVHGNWPDKQGNVLAEIHEVVVRKEYQGKGIGGTLLQQALGYAMSLRRSRVGLWVGLKNTRAAAIYEKLGFRHVSTWKIWRRMILDLPQVDERGQHPG